MEILIFKTNVNNREQTALIKPLLNKSRGIKSWTIDHDDVDKVLRVEAEKLMPTEVVFMLNQAGFLCEELPD